MRDGDAALRTAIHAFDGRGGSGDSAQVRRARRGFL